LENDRAFPVEGNRIGNVRNVGGSNTAPLIISAEYNSMVPVNSTGRSGAAT
jgi:hypothetical protein